MVPIFTLIPEERKLLMKYIIIDLEMSPVAKQYIEERKVCRTEIIEIGAVMLSENLKEISAFKTYVKPQLNTEIPRKYEKLTGITTAMVEQAPVFHKAYQAFVSWCESFQDSYQIYAWSDSDLHQVLAEMEMKSYTCSAVEERMFDEWYDFQKEYGEKIGIERPLALEKAVNYSGADFVGRQHDALFDARNTADLFALTRDDDRFKKVMKPVLEALKPEPCVVTLGDMFNFADLKFA